MALTGNKQPDISYQYGTNMPQLAQSPKVVDLTQRVQEAGFNWNDYFPGERDVATVEITTPQARAASPPGLNSRKITAGNVSPAIAATTGTNARERSVSSPMVN